MRMPGSGRPVLPGPKHLRMNFVTHSPLALSAPAKRRTRPATRYQAFAAGLQFLGEETDASGNALIGSLLSFQDSLEMLLQSRQIPLDNFPNTYQIDAELAMH